MQAAIYTIHETDETKLAGIMAEMRTLGAPTIRACWQGDCYCALEGVHRIEAARRLGLPIHIIDMDESDMLDDHDLYDLDDEVAVTEVIGWITWTNGGHIMDCEVVA